ERQRDAVERRLRPDRPTLREQVGELQAHERGNHPEREKKEENAGRVTTTNPEHQTDRASGRSHHRGQGRCVQEDKKPTVHWQFEPPFPEAVRPSNSAPTGSAHVRMVGSSRISKCSAGRG